MVETNATCQNFKLYAVMIPEWRKIWQVPYPGQSINVFALLEIE